MAGHGMAWQGRVMIGKGQVGIGKACVLDKHAAQLLTSGLGVEAAKRAEGETEQKTETERG